MQIHVNVYERQGWFFAVSDDLRGLFVVHRRRDVVVAEIPAAIKLLLKAKYEVDFTVVKTSSANAQSEELVYFVDPTQPLIRGNVFINDVPRYVRI